MRSEKLNFLFSPISSLKGVGEKFSKLLERLCGPVILDLVYHLPSQVIYRPFIEENKDIPKEGYATLRVKVLNLIPSKNRKQPYKVICLWGDISIELIFFHAYPNSIERLYRLGEVGYLSGKLEKTTFGYQMIHPNYFMKEKKDIPLYEPIYPLTGGVSVKFLGTLIKKIIPSLPDLEEWLDKNQIARENWSSWKKSMEKIHYPQNELDLNFLSKERRRLAYDELLSDQLALMLLRDRRQKGKGLAKEFRGELSTQIIQNLEFKLTKAQQKAIDEINFDLKSTQKMGRLLQGDVGSGKTIVALITLINTVEAGFQGALMAPTDILARQHFRTLKELSLQFGIECEILTGREKGKKREEILTRLANGNIQILIGTHALISELTNFSNLGLVVIDEQHKFGVQQRLTLANKGLKTDLLVMTATPIPRTLAMTLYGDMDVSILDEKPANRKPIKTCVVSKNKYSEIVEKISKIIQQKKSQIYWVCPLVEESEKLDLIAVQKRFNELQSVFGERVGLIHGKMKGVEKDIVMEAFIQGKLDILVSTTVIEVGVDVKNADCIIIEHAERFGLAGLHQLRGRVGRGDQESSCLLMYAFPLSENAKARLEIMRQTENGFKIAEEDLRLRGGGEILGNKQSGLPEFKIADLAFHQDLLKEAHQEAKKILKDDPFLNSERGKALKILLYLFHKEKSIE